MLKIYHLVIEKENKFLNIWQFGEINFTKLHGPSRLPYNLMRFSISSSVRFVRVFNSSSSLSCEITIFVASCVGTDGYKLATSKDTCTSWLSIFHVLAVFLNDREFLTLVSFLFKVGWIMSTNILEIPYVGVRIVDTISLAG